MIPHMYVVQSDCGSQINPVTVIESGHDHQCFYSDFNRHKNTDTWLFSRGLCYHALYWTTQAQIYSYKRKKAGYTL